MRSFRERAIKSFVIYIRYPLVVERRLLATQHEGNSHDWPHWSYSCFVLRVVTQPFLLVLRVVAQLVQ